MRVTESTGASFLARITSESKQQLQRQHEIIASGVRFKRRSDAPNDAATAAQIERNMKAGEQWQRNVQQALVWEQSSEAAMSNIVDRVHRLSELAVEAGDGSRTSEDRSYLADEVNGILDDLLSIGNTQHGDSYLFAGNDAGEPPFNATYTDGKITAVTYDGSAARRTVQANHDTTLDYGVPGAGANGLFGTVDDANGLFAHVIALRDELAAGERPTDASHDGVQQGLEHVIAQRLGNGIRQQRFNRLDRELATVNLNQQSNLSDIQDVDIAEAVTHLNQIEAAYQASLQLSLRANRMSLSELL